jgi:aspartate carbamoyltransferase catalytic subunit
LTKYSKASIVNGGDGAHAHPTQALLDLFTITRHIKELEGKTVAIVGDVKNSRVANSNIELLPRFGLKVLLCAPPHFMPKTDLPQTYSIKEAVEMSDIVMCLRTQIERHETQSYASLKDYARDYCLTKAIVGDKRLLALHPGPVNRNVDISDDFLSDERCKVLEQVQNGVAVRMAVLEKIVTMNYY